MQTVLFAGAGVRGGMLVGSSHKIGGRPPDPQSPDNMAATIHHALGIPRTIQRQDILGRPHEFYEGEPIAGLF